MTFENNGWVKLQKFEEISDDKNTFYCVKPLEKFLGTSESCKMTAYSGAFNKPVFDGNKNLLKISEEKNKNRYLYIGGDMISSFLTYDKIYKYISNMGNNLIPYSIAVGEENIYFLTPLFKFIKRGIIEIIESMKGNENFVDLLNYHDSNCRKNSNCLKN